MSLAAVCAWSFLRATVIALVAAILSTGVAGWMSSGATPTARRGRARQTSDGERQTASHAHAKPWAWHPNVFPIAHGINFGPSADAPAGNLSGGARCGTGGSGTVAGCVMGRGGGSVVGAVGIAGPAILEPDGEADLSDDGTAASPGEVGESSASVLGPEGAAAERPESGNSVSPI